MQWLVKFKAHLASGCWNYLCISLLQLMSQADISCFTKGSYWNQLMVYHCFFASGLDSSCPPANLKLYVAPSLYNSASSVTRMYPFRTHVSLTSFYAQYKRKVIPPLSAAEYRRSRGLAPLAFNLHTKWNWVYSSFTQWIGSCTLYAVSYVQQYLESRSMEQSPSGSRNSSHFTEHECFHRLHKSLSLIPIVGEVWPTQLNLTHVV
jgi:hypothetical protein